MFVHPTGLSPAPSTTGVLAGSSEDLTVPTTGSSGCEFQIASLHKQLDQLAARTTDKQSTPCS